MKRLTILLPIYFLILACMPCADTDDSSVNKGQISITKSTNQDHDRDNETCSPFCSCNCCGQRASNQKALIITNSFGTVPEIKQTATQSFSLQNVLQQIWQPPQLV